MWTSTRILWDQQIFLLWLLLPPIFVVCGLLALAAPYLVSRKKPEDAEGGEFISEQAVVVDRQT